MYDQIFPFLISSLDLKRRYSKTFRNPLMFIDSPHIFYSIYIIFSMSKKANSMTKIRL